MGVRSVARLFGWRKVDKPDVALFRCTNCSGRNLRFGRHQRSPQDSYGALNKNNAFAREHTRSTTAQRWRWRWRNEPRPWTRSAAGSSNGHAAASAGLQHARSASPLQYPDKRPHRIWPGAWRGGGAAAPSLAAPPRVRKNSMQRVWLVDGWALEKKPG